MVQSDGAYGTGSVVDHLAGLGHQHLADLEAGSEGARQLLRVEQQPTAVVAGNDQQAVGALWILARAGISVPGQMSIAGYDDTRFACLSAVDLRTASQDIGGLGRLAVEAALRRIDNPEPAAHRPVCNRAWSVRSSTAAPTREH